MYNHRRYDKVVISYISRRNCTFHVAKTKTLVTCARSRSLPPKQSTFKGHARIQKIFSVGKISTLQKLIILQFQGGGGSGPPITPSGPAHEGPFTFQTFDLHKNTFTFLNKRFSKGPYCISKNRSIFKRTSLPSNQSNFKRIQVGKDQEKAQSEKDSHSKNRGGKKPN